MTTILVALVIVLLAVSVALAGFNALLAWRVEKIVPPRGTYATIDGIRLHYVECGSGPPVVLLHGLASQLQSYTYALDRLLQSRYRLLIPDRPGSGYSQPGPDASLQTQADLLSGLLRERGIGRALVVGHSLGGALALAFALAHPEQVAALTLISPVTQPQNDPPDALKGLAVRSKLMRWIYGWTIAAPLGIRHREGIVTALFGPDPAPSDFGTRGGSLLTLRPWNFRNACADLEAVARELPIMAQRYGEIRKPVGILFGAGDRILECGVHGGRLREQIEGAELELVENGGHMTPLSSPERCAAFIDRMAARGGLMPANEVATG